MKTPMFTRVCAFLMIGAGVIFAANGAEWSSEYDAQNTRYTLTNSVNGTALYLTMDGVLSVKTAGTVTELDLRSAALPKGLPEIVKVGNFRGLASTLEKLYLPESTKMISGSAFQGCTALKYVKLPEGLEVIGGSAFQSCTALELIEPCVPGTVTNIGMYAFLSCSSMTNGFEFGFGTDPTKECVFQMNDICRAFQVRGCHKAPYLRFGPCVYMVPTMIYEGTKLDNLEWIEFGVNVTNFTDNYKDCSKLTNMIFQQTKDFTFRNFQLGWADQSFHPLPSTMREITWHGWFEYTCNAGNPFSEVGALKMRFIVPGNNLKWAAFMADKARMTPWNECKDADKTNYYTRYGSDAKEPAGISVAVSGGLNRTYIVTDGTTYDGNTIQVADFESAFGKVKFNPEPDANGNFAAGDVTVTFEGAEGVTFTGWEGDVAEEDKTKTTITIAASGIKNLMPRFTSTFLVYNKEKGELTDGQWVMVAEGEKDAITVKGLKRNLDSSFLMDFQRPIYGGGKIIKMTSSVGIATGYKFPLTLESISGFTYDKKQYEPFLPDSVTNVGGSAFHWCTEVRGNLRLGFATNAAGESVETKVGTGTFTWMIYLGPEVRLGPGIRKIPYCMFREAYGGTGRDYDGPFDFWIGPNVEQAITSAAYGMRGTDTATPRPLSVHFEGDMFDGSSGMFMPASVSWHWNGLNRYVVDSWTVSDYPKAYSIRFYIGADGCKKWLEFLSDSSKVKVWDKCTEEEQAAYWAMFPKGDVYGKKHPYGLTLGGAVMTNETDNVLYGTGLPKNQWVFSLKQAGFIMRLQ
jgi:hypothetical protein